MELIIEYVGTSFPKLHGMVYNDLKKLSITLHAVIIFHLLPPLILLSIHLYSKHTRIRVSKQFIMCKVEYHLLGPYKFDYHWLSLIIMDYHWLSLIIIDYMKIQKRWLTDSVIQWQLEKAIHAQIHLYKEYHFLDPYKFWVEREEYHPLQGLV